MSSSEDRNGESSLHGSGNNDGNNATPNRAKFNVTRTSRITKVGVPLVVGGLGSSAAGGGGTSDSSGNSPISTDASPTAPQPRSGASSHGAEQRNASRSVSPIGTPPLAPQPRPYEARSRTPACGGTPTAQDASPAALRTTPVPLITPRYQRKSRAHRGMQLTDSFPGHSANAGQLRSQHGTESLTVTNGPQQYQQEMHFHTYEVYRHGSRQIHSRSVGYSSDGDLVMTREDYSEPSDVDNGVTRLRTVISNPTVLDPTARRPLTDSELNSKKKLHLRRPRYKKYPGVYAPRNKRIRNRLMNDYFVGKQAMQLLNAARERREEGIDDDTPPPKKKSFQDLPSSVLKAFDLADEAQERELKRLGAMRDANAGHAQPSKDPDSAEGRFQKLNLRLRGELQHALGSEFLSQQIEDLEVCFSEFIDRGPTPESLVFHFRDGYGRLVCHGVAAFYQLVSESRSAGDGSLKLTYVSFPKSKKAGSRELRLPYASLTHVLRGSRSSIPARHPLSANTTPLQGPQPSPAQAAATASQRLGEPSELEPMSPLDLDASASYPAPRPLPGARATTAALAEGQPPKDAVPASCPDDSAEAPVGNDSVSSLDEDGEEGKRQVLVNPTVVTTVNGKLPVTKVPVYAPHFQLKHLALVVDRCGGMADTNDLDEMPQLSDISSSSSSSSDEDEDEERQKWERRKRR